MARGAGHGRWWTGLATLSPTFLLCTLCVLALTARGKLIFEDSFSTYTLTRARNASCLGFAQRGDSSTVLIAPLKVGIGRNRYCQRQLRRHGLLRLRRGMP